MPAMASPTSRTSVTELRRGNRSPAEIPKFGKNRAGGRLAVTVAGARPVQQAGGGIRGHRHQAPSWADLARHVRVRPREPVPRHGVRISLVARPRMRRVRALQRKPLRLALAVSWQ